jgi:hypothetical protein
MNRELGYIFPIIIGVLLCACFGKKNENAVKGNYASDSVVTNEYAIPILVNITDSSGEEGSNLLLGVGDVYEGADTEGGILYPGYLLLPDIASNTAVRAERDEQEKCDDDASWVFSPVEGKRIAEAMKANRLPEWWKEKVIAEASELKECYDEFDDDDSEEEGIAFSKPVVNLDESDLDSPDGDPDGDGISNLEEMYSGTNPFVPNLVYLSPGVQEVDYSGGAVVTNVFYAINSTGTNVSCNLKVQMLLEDVFLNKAKVDSIRPEISCELPYEPDGIGEIYVELPPGKVKFYYVCDSEKLKNALLAPFYVALSVDDNFLQQISFFALLQDPKLYSPSLGEKFKEVSDVSFSWEKGSGVPVAISNFCDRLFLYKVVGNTSHDLSTTVVLSNDFISASDLYGKELASGGYVWGIRREVIKDWLVFSEWRWFSVGERIKLRKNDEADRARVKNYSSYYHEKEETFFHEIQVGKNFIFLLSDDYKLSEWKKKFGKANDFAVSLKFDLPKGLKLDSNARLSAVSGKPEESGVFTNYFIITKDGKEKAQRHVFIVE